MATSTERHLGEPERIYIGGLDPPRLTAKDVLDRFDSIMTASKLSNTPAAAVVEIQSVESRSDKPYCHVVAALSTTTDSQSERESSALKILVSTFNNVKWKGCRLIVQAARPHFLQLLEQERQELQQQKEKQHQAEEESKKDRADEPQGDQDKTETTQSSNIPRKLRIRRKFGEASYHVDQKPWSVQDWSSLTHALGKQRKRVEKHVQETKDAYKQQHQTKKKTDANPSHKQHTMIMPPPLTHRAIHIQFSDNDDPKLSSRQTESQIPVDTAAQGHLSDEMEITSDDSSTRSSSEESLQSSAQSQGDHDLDDGDMKKALASGNPAYAWSDDEGSDNNENSEICDESEPELLPGATSTNTSPNNGESDEENQESDPTSNQGNSSKGLKLSAMKVPDTKSDSQLFSPVDKNIAYEWSSDEDSTDKEEDVNDDNDDYSRYKNRPLVPVTQSDEFAAGLDLNEDQIDESRDEEVGHLTEPWSKDQDLSNDVTLNLGILSSLFPEVADALPAVVKESEDCETEKVKEGSSNIVQSGFAASGIMLRYDPKNTSTQQFEIEETKIEESSPITATENSDDPPSSSDDESTGKAETQTKDDQTKGNNKNDSYQEQPVMVYQQKKLEDVFREARDTWKGGQPTEKSLSPATGTVPGGAFSFGFDLGKPESSNNEEAQSRSVFSFGFALPESSEPTASGTTCSEENWGQSRDTELISIENPRTSVKVPEKRIRGFFFPGDVIEKYKASFFSANNGDEIAKDVAAFRDDPQVKEAWNRERHALTQDWKRKRKHAQSRIQKIMKIR